MRITTLFFHVSILFGTALAATPGCGSDPSTLHAGVNNLTVNGKSRRYTLTLPTNYNNTNPYRLVLGFHGLFETMDYVAKDGEIKPYFGLQALADDSTIFIAPDGLNSGIGTGWANENGEDIEFVRAIVNATNTDLCINENLRFATGFSYGGGMSYSIACTLSQEFRAVAVLSGALLSGCEGGTDPVAYYAQHGVRDTVLPIESGREIRDTFVKNNGCTVGSPAEPAAGSGQHILTKYTGCKDDKPVWWTAFDEGHTTIPSNSGSGTDKENTFTDDQVWAFFSQFT